MMASKFTIENGELKKYEGDDKEVVIPEGVTEIGAYAFSGCESLTSITIPEGVTKIGWRAFRDCENLTSITIPEGVTEIGDDAFFGTAWLKEQRKKDSLVIVNSILIDGKSAKGDAVIPEGVTKICSEAFRWCLSLKSITIPEGVTEIGCSAFEGCSSLKSITIPGSATEIGYCAFEGCSSLKSIIIPEGVTEIGWGAFDGCESLTSITIHEGITEIGQSTFYNCKSLAGIKIPKSVTKIGYRAFSGCSKMKSISLPDGVTGITVDIDDVSVPATVYKNTFPEKLEELSANIPIADIPAAFKYPAVCGFCRASAEGRVFSDEVTAGYNAYIKRNRKKFIENKSLSKFVGIYMVKNKMLDDLEFSDLSEQVLASPDTEYKAAILEYKKNQGQNFDKELKTQIKKANREAGKEKARITEEEYNALPIGQKIEKKKKLSEKEKSLLLEETVLSGTPENIDLFYSVYGDAEFTARALGYACGYGGIEKVKKLIAHKASFDYQKTGAFQKKYEISAHLSNKCVIYDDYKLLMLCNYNSVSKNVSFQNTAASRGAAFLQSEERISIARLLIDENIINGSDLMFNAVMYEDLSLAEALAESGIQLCEPMLVMGMLGNDADSQQSFWSYTSKLQHFGKKYTEKALLFIVGQLEKRSQKLYVNPGMMGNSYGYWDCKGNSLCSAPALKILIEKADMSRVKLGSLATALAEAGMKDAVKVIVDTGIYKSQKRIDELMEIAEKNSKK